MDNKKEKERFFSIELKSRAHITSITLKESYHENVLLEGTLGQLQYASFTDDVILEVVGDKGALRINLSKDEIGQEMKVNEH